MTHQQSRNRNKRIVFQVLGGLLVFLVAMSIFGCGEKKKTETDLIIGNWTHYRNRAYILLVITAKGTWNSSVRIADATSKIVSSKGSANGSWHIEEGQVIFTVVASDIESIWEKNDTSFFEIVELGDRVMLLKDENGRVAEWKKTGSQKEEQMRELAQTVPMAPYAVNLNKHSSNAEDRYLCLKMNLKLKELMPDQKVPVFHPRARDAAIMFLSSLVYEDVENFERIKAQKAKLVDVLNPYMEGTVKDIEVEQVIIASSIEKVEEFIIEHTVGKTDKKGDKGGAPGDGANPAKEKKKDA